MWYSQDHNCMKIISPHFYQNNNLCDNIKSYSDVVLEPSSAWNYDNLYVVAVLWQQNGANYRFVNLVK